MEPTRCCACHCPRPVARHAACPRPPAHTTRFACQALRGTGALSPAKPRELQTRITGLFEAGTYPLTYKQTSGPMGLYFNAVPSISKRGVPLSTLKHGNPAWHRWVQSPATVPAQAWLLGRNTHASAGPVGFDRESRLRWRLRGA